MKYQYVLLDIEDRNAEEVEAVSPLNLHYCAGCDDRGHDYYNNDKTILLKRIKEEE